MNRNVKSSGWMALLPSCGMVLMACGSTERDAEAESQIVSVSHARLVTTVLVDASTPAYYNAALGTVLDGTQPQFPLSNLRSGDPTLHPAAEPNLSAASAALGNWLSPTPLPLGSSWSAPVGIPSTWAVNTETAVLYVLDAGAAGMRDVEVQVGVDNGVFVWLDGRYQFGALAPGGFWEGEYSIPLGALSPGRHFLQVLREDHGGGTGYVIQVTGVANELPPPAPACEPGSGQFTAAGTTAALHVQHTATPLGDGRVLVVGGYSRTSELHDPASGAWSATGNTRTPHRRHTATRLKDGRVLVAGGDGSTASASAEFYDPASGTWTSTGNLLTNRRDHSAVLLADGRVLVMGGSTPAGGVLASAELYDPASGTWSSTGGMAHARRAFSATVLPEGRVLVAGGLVNGGDECTGGNCLASAEVYDPASGTWSSTGGMTLARGFHAAAGLAEGQVLVSGGGMDGATSVRAEVYDSKTGTWAATGEMSAPRRRHSLTVLENGEVLAVGGYDASTGIHSSAEVYEPRSGLWCRKGGMSQGRYGHTATLLPEGRVLVTAGVSNASQYTAEAYDVGD